jgi:hypothetical protein
MCSDLEVEETVGESGVSLINGIVVWWGIPISTAAPQVWEDPGLPCAMAADYAARLA